MNNVVMLADYRGTVNDERGLRRPPRPPGNTKARDFELIAMVSAIPYAARRQLSEWDQNYIRILSTGEWYGIGAVGKAHSETAPSMLGYHQALSLRRRAQRERARRPCTEGEKPMQTTYQDCYE